MHLATMDDMGGEDTGNLQPGWDTNVTTLGPVPGEFAM